MVDGRGAGEGGRLQAVVTGQLGRSLLCDGGPQGGHMSQSWRREVGRSAFDPL